MRSGLTAAAAVRRYPATRRHWAPVRRWPPACRLPGGNPWPAVVRRQAPQLSAPPPARRGLCAACRIPVPAANARCYPCGLHAETLPGLLADVVVPVCYAVKGSEHARNLWLYKSGRPGAGPARAAIRALLVVFLREHGQCVWRAAGMTMPTHLAVVPSGRGRCRPHPLQALAGPVSRSRRRGLSCAYVMSPEPGTWTLTGSARRLCPARMSCCSTTPGPPAPARSPHARHCGWQAPGRWRSSSSAGMSPRPGCPPPPCRSGRAGAQCTRAQLPAINRLCPW